MAIDLKIVEPVDPDSAVSAFIWPQPAEVDGEYALMQKIVFNLHTAPGEIETDPTFGSGLQSIVLGLTGADQTTAMQRMASVLAKCQQDLKADMPADPAQRLVALRLVDMTYDVQKTAWTASVEVETEANTFTIDVGS
jgi:hypothetical protein